MQQLHKQNILNPHFVTEENAGDQKSTRDQKGWTVGMISAIPLKGAGQRRKSERRLLRLSVINQKSK